MTSVVTLLRHKTLEEAAKKLGVTQDQVLRLVEEGQLRLFARSKPHGLYQNWRVTRNWKKVYRDPLTVMQQIPIELASELLSSRSGRIKVKAVILEGKHKVGLARDGNDIFPSISRADAHFRQEDIQNCMNDNGQAKALNDLTVGPGSSPDQQEGRQSSKQDILFVPQGGDRLTPKLYNFANEIGFENVFPELFRNWLRENHGSDFDVSHGTISFRHANGEFAEVTSSNLRGRIYRMKRAQKTR